VYFFLPHESVSMYPFVFSAFVFWSSLTLACLFASCRALLRVERGGRAAVSVRPCAGGVAALAVTGGEYMHLTEF
jgi:hypothetical protein